MTEARVKELEKELAGMHSFANRQAANIRGRDKTIAELKKDRDAQAAMCRAAEEREAILKKAVEDYAIRVSKDALAASPSAQGGWQPIKTAPKDGSQILLCCATNSEGAAMGEAFGIFVQVAAWWEEENTNGAWVVYCDLISEPQVHFDPTHWMPLPAPPVDSEKGKP